MSRFNQIHHTVEQEVQSLPDFASILIVDDQRFDRVRMRRLCGGFGFNTNVVEAENLASMADRLRKERFDLVLLDYHLPDGTGLQGVEAIRACATNRHAATIMITGSEQNDIALQALKLGFSDYLTKDELSDATLRRSAIIALQKSRLATGMETRRLQHGEMQEILKKFSRECAQEIKPIVSRMMRQMRELREMTNLTPEQATDRVERIEGSCERLWAFLDDLDRYNAAQLVQSMVPRPKAAADITDILKSERTRPKRPATKRKPPSVFGRPRD